MRRALIIFTAAALLTAALTGCGSTAPAAAVSTAPAVSEEPAAADRPVQTAEPGLSGTDPEPAARTDAAEDNAADPEAPANLPQEQTSAGLPADGIQSAGPDGGDAGSTQSSAEESTPESENSGSEDTDHGSTDTFSDAEADAFFADAAFFGNSLLVGLGAFGGLQQGDFYAATSASVVNVTLTQNYETGSGSVTLFDALTASQYGKIFLLLGINEISFEPDYFTELYADLIRRICEAEPDAEIYVMSLTPVTEQTSNTTQWFTMERIESYNTAIAAMCGTYGWKFVDLCPVLAGEDGYLASEESTDGIHLTQDKYPVWADYLRTLAH